MSSSVFEKKESSISNLSEEEVKIPRNYFGLFIHGLLGIIWLSIVSSNSKSFGYLKQNNHPLYAFVIIEIFCRFSTALLCLTRDPSIRSLTICISCLDFIALIIGFSTYYPSTNDEFRNDENNAQLANTILAMIWLKFSCCACFCCLPCILIIVMGTAGLTLAGGLIGGMVGVSKELLEEAEKNDMPKAQT